VKVNKQVSAHQTADGLKKKENMLRQSTDALQFSLITRHTEKML
jgi:hypothetical protein